MKISCYRNFLGQVGMVSIRKLLNFNIPQVSVVFLCFFLISPSAHAVWFSPSNYSECVEKYVKPSKSKRAAAILNHTCRQQFTENIQSSDWEKYYSCVRSNLKNVEIDHAASLLVRSCRIIISTIMPRKVSAIVFY